MLSTIIGGIKLGVFLTLVFAVVAAGIFFIGPILDGETASTDGGEPGEINPPPAGATPVEAELNTSHVEKLIHEAVNEVRKEHGVGELAYNDALADVARDHSEHMAEAEFFGHEDPDGNGPGDRVEADDDVSCSAVGENLAQTYWHLEFRNYDDELRTLESEEELAQWFVDAWMNSTGHRENLLDADWEEEGVGVYHDDQDRVFATQKFCRDDGFFPWRITEQSLIPGGVTVDRFPPWGR